MKSKNDYLTTASKTDEHYTPEGILDFARKVMGVERFDLDVSNNSFNSTNSSRSYTINNSALLESSSWKSTSLWCNPPFSKNLEFSVKLNDELAKGNIQKAVYLSKIDSRTQWWRNLTANSDWLIIKNGYIRFGDAPNNAPFGVVLHGYGLAKSDVMSACEGQADFKPLFCQESLDNYLRKNVRFKDARKIADIFGVSQRSVTQTALQLGLPTKRESVRKGKKVIKQTLILSV